MTWKFKQINNKTQVSINDKEANSKYSLGKANAPLYISLVSMSDCFLPNNIIELRGCTEVLSYKTPKGKTVTTVWNHCNTIFGGTQGLPCN